MFSKTHLLIVVLVFSLLSCEKKTVSPPVKSTPTYTATLKVTVLKFYLNKGNQQTDSALSHTYVYIYNSDYDRTNNYMPNYIGITDSAGLVVFSGLTQTEYYLSTSNAQFGTKQEDVQTPLNAVALDEVDY
jgi:hypothetical protein